jgi:hypothetical protein
LDILILSLDGLGAWRGRLLLTVRAQSVGVYKVKEAPNEGSSGRPRMPALVRRPKDEALSGGDREALAMAAQSVGIVN